MPSLTVPSLAPTRRTSRSRYSSPATLSSRGAAVAGKAGEDATATETRTGIPLERPRTFMEKWIEPPQQKLPSYQQAGLIKGGVVETMEALGTRPKLALMKKLGQHGSKSRAPQHNLTRRSLGGSKNITITAPAPDLDTLLDNKSPSLSTPTPKPSSPLVTHTPTAAITGSDILPIKDEVVEIASPRILDSPLVLPSTESDDMAPKRTRTVSAIMNNQNGVSRAPSNRIGALHGRTPSASRQSTISSDATQLLDDATEQNAAFTPTTLRDTVRQVVGCAVRLALVDQQYETAWALQELARLSSENPQDLHMLHAIFTQTAEPEMVKKFAKSLSKQKKVARKGQTAYKHFTIDDPEHQQIQPDPQPAAFGHLITLDRALFLPDPVSLTSKSQPNAPAEAAALELQDDQPKPKRIKLINKAGNTRKQSPILAAEELSIASVSSQPADARMSPGVETPAASASPLSSDISITPPSVSKNDRPRRLPASRSKLVSQATQDTRSRRGSADMKQASEPVASPQPITTQRRTRARNFADKPILAPISTTITPVDENANTSTFGAAIASVPDVTHTVAASVASSSSSLSDLSGMPGILSEPSSPQAVASDVQAQDIPDRKAPIFGIGEALKLGGQFKIVKDSDFPVHESWVRPHLGSQDPSDEIARSPRKASGAPQQLAAGGATTNGRSTRSNKRQHDEVDDTPETSPAAESSTVVPPALIAPNAGTNAVTDAASSRPGTPTNRPTKRQRASGLRVKTSPMKQRTGPSAGIPRGYGQRMSPAPGGLAQDSDENDDYCASCGGTGTLVCCDGCKRAFHLICIDPAISEPMSDDWYCNVCQSRLNPVSSVIATAASPFDILSRNLDKKNSSAFRLPSDVRDRFENVRTGPDGEYEEFTSMPPKLNAKKKPEDPDLIYRLCDAQDEPIVCHLCDGHAGSNRPIIPCSACGYHWHLDCLDPPLASAPNLKTWKCPVHLDYLTNLVPSHGPPVHKFRHIKNAPLIKPAYRRGVVNHGNIEVDDDLHVDGEADGAFNQSGYRDMRTFGRSYLLSARGIEADFIDKIRRENASSSAAAHAAMPSVVTRAAPVPLPSTRNEIDRQQAAINLLGFSQAEASSGTSMLIEALVDNADPTIISIMARGGFHNSDNSTINSADYQSLLAMQEQTKLLQQALEARLKAFSSLQVPAAATSIKEPGPDSTLTPASEAARDDMEGVSCDETKDQSRRSGVNEDTASGIATPQTLPQLGQSPAEMMATDA